MMEPIPSSQTSAISPRAAVFALGVLLLVAGAFVAFPAVTAERGQVAAPAAADPFAAVTLGAKAAIVVDITTGKTLYEKNPDVQLPLASLTKVALALVVAEALPLDAIITIPYYTSGANGESLEKGERWSVEDLLDFTLVASSNQGAEILADAANDVLHERYPESPENAATLWRMNELVKELGLQHTFYLNVSGLDLSTTQAGAYGSAHDMALLFAYAASAEPSLFAGTTRNGILLTSQERLTRAAENTNTAQGAIPGLIMGKTGFTDLAGGNLAVVFDVGLARPVVAVVLGSSEEGRFDDIKKLVSTTRLALTAAQ